MDYDKVCVPIYDVPKVILSTNSTDCMKKHVVLLSHTAIAMLTATQTTCSKVKIVD